MVKDHVYHREISADIRTSLSVIASLIDPKSRVLDLGTGSGALGKHLSLTQACLVDGLTFNEDEAKAASPHYRKVAIADLETCSLTTLFEAESYDFIVCADVLEHIRHPERILLNCQSLLAPGGKFLISVPNLSYSGLVADLLAGEFLYRDEGLLDRTHLRFFTRRSLLRLLASCGLHASHLDVVNRSLDESEFQTQFDALPPGVARYLLARPDSLAYQIIVAASPGTAVNLAGVDEMGPNAESLTANAIFSTQMYFGHDDGFSEDRKIIQRGLIGSDRQTLSFVVPTQLRSSSRVRFDPADRIGYCYLYSISLHADDRLVWQWTLDELGTAQIGELPHHEIIFRPPVAGAAPTLLFLKGADPWIELPLPSELLASLARCAKISFNVEMGWPMSADYMALASSLNQLQLEATKQAELGRQSAANSELVKSRAAQLEIALEQSRIELTAAVQFESNQKVNAVSELAAFAAEAGQKFQSLTVETGRKIQSLESECATLRGQLSDAQIRIRDLLNEKQALHANNADATARLTWIENSRLFRWTRPLIHAKMRLNPLLQHFRNFTQVSEGKQTLFAGTKPLFCVDVVVPVYRGLEDTQRCINSVLQCRCVTPFRVVVINDASPEPALTDWLREISLSDSRVLLLENNENLGFVETVNRGMSLSDSHDIVLLNSDTEVANDWLDRLKSAAHIGDKVGTVTPFSNNATICSYPLFCGENPMVESYTTRELDALFAQANSGQVVDIPTGVGFCMYIRRECLSAIGLFDVTNFGKGYGEENDFCRRAAGAGWRNLHALDIFVLHAGGVSFGASKNERVLAALQTLARLYPDYDSLVQDFIRRDPAALARHRVDLARAQRSGKHKVLFVMHDRAGGTLRHVGELAKYLAQEADFYALVPNGGGAVLLRRVGQHEGLALSFYLPQEFDSLVVALQSIGVSHIHFHHLIGHSESVLKIPDALGLPFDFTAHDYYALCPQISLTDKTNRYCKELGLAQCRQCLKDAPAPGGLDIETWRERSQAFLGRARYIFAPSQDTAKRFTAFVPDSQVIVAPHVDLHNVGQLPAPKPVKLSNGEPLRILVIGALSPIKGADILEDLAVMAKEKDAPLAFHLVGYGYRHLLSQPDANLTLHGQYAEEDLPRLIEESKCHLVWYPALWPETYSYTLSAGLSCAMPIVAPDLGAFGERLRHRPWSWIQAWHNTPAEWLIFFCAIRENNFVAGIPPRPVNLQQENFGSSSVLHWNYLTDYLQGRPKNTATPTLSSDFLAVHQAGRPNPYAGQQIKLKRHALGVVMRLRSAPSLSGIVRAVPLRWQTRVKTWLRA